jgi:hypothetical protein
MAMTVSPLNYMIGKGIVSIYTGAAAITRWAATTAYAINDHVILSTGTILKASTGGTSDASEPTAAGLDGTVTWAAVTLSDIGNVGKFEFQPEAKTLEHNSARGGVSTVDLVVDLQRRAKLSLEMDEITMENLEFALLGTMGGTSPNRKIALFNAPRSNVVFDLVGTNDIGHHFHVVFPSCRIYPPKSLGFIDENFIKMAVDADVFSISPDNSFGTIMEIA